jgi:hypothetical protein
MTIEIAAEYDLESNADKSCPPLQIDASEVERDFRPSFHFS